MSDIKALLTEMGTKEGSDAGSQKDYHDSHSSSVKRYRNLVSSSTPFFLATICIPMQSAQSLNPCIVKRFLTFTSYFSH